MTVKYTKQDSLGDGRSQEEETRSETRVGAAVCTQYHNRMNKYEGALNRGRLEPGPVPATLDLASDETRVGAAVCTQYHNRMNKYKEHSTEDGSSQGLYQQHSTWPQMRQGWEQVNSDGSSGHRRIVAVCTQYHNRMNKYEGALNRGRLEPGPVPATLDLASDETRVGAAVCTQYHNRMNKYKEHSTGTARARACTSNTRLGLR
ncbi:hypothetical protein J6590_058738 [Homalodisca vitripennis]|nr:hypothetical protein J6590_058738 [Homalodisca vitripennis]